ncbi:lysophospholipid acyltransferase family protein [Loigolactobacillus backii]|uniref:lysophospholipid acyltransferase family protein n=1 Tax=Loigolactobacillus backii TaxID=375175 RepID=UPI0007F07BE5|nr:lysophospholipid acyltransferase family protein [Loigolactobacillus backii]ANK58886.1 acyl-phosphate glycerol 3-phosphate acyltransferase [Loigolactobacillus backii]
MIDKLIVQGGRTQVIANIQKAAEEGRFNDKVETDDPELSRKQQEEFLASYLEKETTKTYKYNNVVTREIMNIATRVILRSTQVEGLENVQNIAGGGIVTSNHFSPLDSLVVHKTVKKMSKSRLYVVSELENLQMPGFLGYLMTYYDTIPLGPDKDYMGRQFPEALKNILDQKQLILIYSEQEMWFNYRKPRPVKRGAYYYAAKFNVPIISCFVEMRDLPDIESDNFKKVAYIMHVLKPIYPDPAKAVRDNSLAMMKQDYAQKCAAYEKAYQVPLDYTFRTTDIAGWMPPKTEMQASVNSMN